MEDAAGRVMDDAAPHLLERYRAAVPDAAVWNPVIESLVRHRSVRAYRPDKLPPGTLEALVAAAQSAATSSNLQTWSVVAVEDQARRNRLAELAGGQRHIAQAPLFLCWLADLSRATRMADGADRDLAAVAYLETFLVAVIDAALAAQNAAAAAESLGLGTVYIGAMRNQPEAVAAELSLPQGTMVAFGLCVGFEDESAHAHVKPRLPQHVVLHREQYGALPEAGAIAAYDGTLQAFQRDEGMAQQPWSDLVFKRLGSIGAMSGRDRLRAALNARGFLLR